ncbi:MAG TPA: GntR family transcriptional regulator [Rectinemataceae bacterium]|nr:GntR family transcriptional regulator [Rectinemataceae bacterium]
MNIEPIEAQSLEKVVYLNIKNRIISLEIPPEETLNINSLAASLNVSITPVRGALQLLEREDLIRRIHNKGFFVAPMTKLDSEYVYEMRLSLELLALERAIVNIDKKKLDNLIKKMVELLELHDKSPTSLPYELDYSLHDLIISSCGNPYLQHTYERLMANIQRYRNVIRKFSPPDDMNWVRSELEQHIQIGELILKGDLGSAKELLARHIKHLISIVSEKLSNIAFPIPITKE